MCWWGRIKKLYNNSWCLRCSPPWNQNLQKCKEYSNQFTAPPLLNADIAQATSARAALRHRPSKLLLKGSWSQRGISFRAFQNYLRVSVPKSRILWVAGSVFNQNSEGIRLLMQRELKKIEELISLHSRKNDQPEFNRIKLDKTLK